MNAWRNWAVRILDSDAPKVAETKGKGLCVRQGGIVKIVIVVVQVFEKVIVILASEKL